MNLDKNKVVLINTDCLEALSRMVDNSVHLVYLDPPWNTGSDFVSSIDKSLKFYVEFIYRVIQQAHRILKPEGNLILYSNPSLNTNFHNIIRPIFGEENFKAEFIIPVKRMNIRNKKFQHTHETVIYYSKSKNAQFFPLVEKTSKEIDSLFPMQEDNKRYKLELLTVYGERNNLNFEWKGFNPPINKIWRFTKERMDFLDDEGKIFYKNDLAFPKLKRYSDENSTALIGSVWEEINPYDNSKNGFINSQSEALIKKIINITTVKGDKVCDPFAGSGITGFVCSKLERDWVGIENNEIISRLAYERIMKINPGIKIAENFILKPIIWNSYSSFNLSAAEIAKEKISKGENERVEFKGSYHYSHQENRKINELPDKIMKEIAAFLNSKYGGSIFLGVQDDGTILGLEKDFEISGRKKNQDAFELVLTSKIKDSFGGISIDLIDWSFHEIDSKSICEIKVNPYEKPIFLNKEFYSRNGTQSLTLKNQEFFELMKKRRNL